jgi:WD40 repeat protein
MGLLPIPCHTQQLASIEPKRLPPPFETIQDPKQFNAVHLGPGNKISIAETPADFRLEVFAMSPDGRLLAAGWGSGRIEIWDLHTRQKASEFKSGLGAPGTVQFDSAGNKLVVTGSSGKIAFLDALSGRKLKEWSVSLGKHKYAIQEVVLDPQGKWLAYANEESSKVLDLTTDSPRVLVDLKDAGSLALSQDSRELWITDRKELERFSTESWQSTGRWPLKSRPVADSSVVVRTGVMQDGRQTVAVPSSKGLVIYREPEMSGEYVTEDPTSRVAFARGSNSYVNLAKDMTFLTAVGKIQCRRSYSGSAVYAISDDGQWLALSQASSVELWHMEDLLHDCAAAP